MMGRELHQINPLTLRVGASTGIGAATVKYLHSNGAKVVFGDVNEDAGSALIKAHDGLKFVHCDVSKYSDIYNVFRVAQDQYGRVDHAISCAGVFEQVPLSL